MYLGRIVEEAPTEALYDTPLHPYTQALLAAVPEPDPERRRARRTIAGDIPNPENPPSGCAFHPRCPHAAERCRREIPALRARAGDRRVACHLHDES
ncbi:MAG: oligopeptide/dipeptide ABC transporter ATP-binding protein, partial [Alphaproteobacteria bacterium]